MNGIKEMSKEDIIFQLLLSLNIGGSCYVQDRVWLAMQQYEKLKEYGIINEEGDAS